MVYVDEKRKGKMVKGGGRGRRCIQREEGARVFDKDKGRGVFV